MSPEEWDEARRSDVLAKLAVHEQRLGEAERDVDSIARAQRDGLRDLGKMLDEALTKVDVSCAEKVQSVKVDVDKLATRLEGRKWSRGEILAWVVPSVLTATTLITTVLTR